MTRKRAIEAAVQQAIGDHKLPATEVLRLWVSAGTAFDLGLIAGLRKAARMLKGDNLPGYGMLRQHANTLAKKARGK